MVRLSSIQRFRFLLLFLLADFFVDVNTYQAASAAAAANAQQAPGHQLSPRTISTKYGQIRGAVLYFQPTTANPHLNSPHLNSPASDKSNGPNGQQPNKQNTNTNYLQPVEFFLGVPYATGKPLIVFLSFLFANKFAWLLCWWFYFDSFDSLIAFSVCC